MSELRELYQSVILDHNKRPRNFCEPERANRQADGINPLCGDKLTVYLEVEGDVVVDVGFIGSGCAISTASASLMTEAVKGKSVSAAQELFENFHKLVTSDSRETGDPGELGKLAVFTGVREFPVRVKCATLAWHTLSSALAGSDDVATTE
jgi:nitrogen fixation NifU-like protein